ncbi:MAG: hypothetical protein IJ851_03045 [Eubacterium sp.]|nr:hypothetical protein [Eubacterium sp.]
MAKDIKEKKSGFKPGVYAGFAILIVAVVLVALTIFAVSTKYTGFNAEKTAQSYVDTVVQKADGYNAYKQTLVSKNQKYGDFVINAYMKPYVNDGDDVEQREFADTNEEASVKTPLYDTMYDYYKELIATYGWDDYDSIYSNYFARLSQERKARYGDEYMDTEFMFGVFESNVSKYGIEVAGADEKLGADEKTVVQEKVTGLYQITYGEDYTFTTTVTNSEDVSDVDAYKAEYKNRVSSLSASGEAKADQFGLTDDDKQAMVSAFEKLDCSEDISAVKKCTVDVTLADGTVLTSIELYVVQIGKSWYVDNTNIDTSSLYFAL